MRRGFPHRKKTGGAPRRTSLSTEYLQQGAKASKTARVTAAQIGLMSESAFHNNRAVGLNLPSV